MNKPIKINPNILYILILLFVTIFHCTFISQKEGYHVDEILSYDLANSEYSPWVGPNQVEGRLAVFMREVIQGDTVIETLKNCFNVAQDVIINKRESIPFKFTITTYADPIWIDNAHFEGYLTTGQDDQFNLLSVYYNATNDVHPPLHYILLHIASSLFPETMSTWIGCSINLLFLLGTCICIIKGGYLLEEHSLLTKGNGKLWASITVLLYGCSAGAIATTLLIRMYGAITFFSVATLYLHTKKWLNGTFHKNNKLLITVTVLGFLSQYFFLFYCITLALVVCIMLITSKRFREAFIYIRSMVIAAIIGVCLYPFSISDVFSTGRGMDAINSFLAIETLFKTKLANFSNILLDRCFGNRWLGIILLLSTLLFAIYKIIKHKKATPVFWLLTLPALGLFALVAIMSPFYADRYIMIIFPIVMMCVSLFVVSATHNLGNYKLYIYIAFVCILSSCSILNYDGEYLFKGYKQQLEIAEEYSNLPCICVYVGHRFYANLPEFTKYDKSMLLATYEFLDGKNKSDIEILDRFVVIAKDDFTEKDVVAALEVYGFQIEQVLLENKSTSDDIYLCVKKQ